MTWHSCTRPSIGRRSLDNGMFGEIAKRALGSSPHIATGPDPAARTERVTVIILGVILLVIGLIVGIPVLTTIGAVLAVAGVVLAILGGTGRRIGGRAHWF